MNGGDKMSKETITAYTKEHKYALLGYCLFAIFFLVEAFIIS